MRKNDRRLFERFEVDFPVEVKQPVAQEEQERRCRDVSASGMGMFSEEALIPGTNLELSLAIPDNRAPFQGLAKVIWSNQIQENRWRSGLEFVKIDFMGLRKIFEKNS